MEQKLHLNSQLMWLTKLMPFDYTIEYMAADALSRVSGAELLALVISNTSSDLLQAIEDSWTIDMELKGLIEGQQIVPPCPQPICI